MHYPDEPYVRKYTRKTITTRRLGWEGRAVRDAMLDEFDRAGIFEVGDDDPAECISLVTEIPIDFVRVALDRLLKTKTWTLTDRALVWPNYAFAQTCARSDKLRQRESRERRAVSAASEPRRHEPEDEPELDEPEPESASHAVTLCHAPSHESHGVTPSLADQNKPYLSDRSRAHGEKGGARKPDPDAVYWPSFPEGWHDWSRETLTEALAHGVTTADLARHVKYWTRRKFPGGKVNDLDGELRDAIAGIAERKAKAGAAESAAALAPSSTSPYAWQPTDAHRTLCKAHGRERELAGVVKAYREAGTPERASSTLRANDDFTARLKWWFQHGEFIASGPLPKASKAVGA